MREPHITAITYSGPQRSTKSLSNLTTSRETMYKLHKLYVYRNALRALVRNLGSTGLEIEWDPSLGDHSRQRDEKDPDSAQRDYPHGEDDVVSPGQQVARLPVGKPFDQARTRLDALPEISCSCPLWAILEQA